MTNSKTIPQDTKKIFWKCGTCSHTFCYLLNREFGHQKEAEERASDLLAGGLMNTGHQCGMLWGSALAAGAESFRRQNDRGQAIAIAIMATQHLMESFSKRTKTLNCRDITGCDLTSKFGLAKLGLKTLLGGFINSPCFNLAAKWAPEAIQSATEGLSSKQTDLPQQPVSCASEVAKKMEASEEEMVMVAGFAGGLGLSGNACGALSAAIWMNTLAWCRKHPGETPPYFNNQSTKKILKAFYSITDSEILCYKLTGQYFKTINDHTQFIKNGGCDKLINVLAQS
jgi:hypothetical protein